MLDTTTARFRHSNDYPDVAEELDATIKKIRKLRWIGREDEARALEIALRQHWQNGSYFTDRTLFGKMVTARLKKAPDRHVLPLGYPYSRRSAALGKAVSGVCGPPFGSGRDL